MREEALWKRPLPGRRRDDFEGIVNRAAERLKPRAGAAEEIGEARLIVGESN